MKTLPVAPLSAREMLNKVPEVTLYFWIIKVLCTTVGETASDYLSENVGLGLTKTTYITSALLLATLVAQFRARRYIPPIYWLGIVLISVVGTQITDNLTDNQGVSLVTTTIVFSIVSRRSLPSGTPASARCRSTRSSPRGARPSTGSRCCSRSRSAPPPATWRQSDSHSATALSAAHVRRHHRPRHSRALPPRASAPITAFWLAYILTRPLGASLGDFLSQPRASGGLGLGTTVTSVIFLGAILVVVGYLTVTRKDVIELQDDRKPQKRPREITVAVEPA